jgi:SAM-dependent methyltransferase
LARVGGDYGFDPAWSDEQRRLALIERCYDPMTFAALTKIGVSQGWHCADVGAGGGSVSRWLRDLVGTGGRVVGIDLDTRFFEDEPGIEARSSDIMNDELEPDAFDVVHCRLLLHHLRGRQVEAVRRLSSMLRPGGIFIASECYLGAMRAPPNRPFAELWRGLYSAMPNADYEWAVSLPADLQTAGLVDIEADGAVDLVRGGGDVAQFWHLTAQAVRARMPEDIDVDAGLATLADPTTFEPSFIWYTAWGRRPPQ